MNCFLSYLALGLLWSGWLEWYCCNNLPVPFNSPFMWRERIFHIFVWPWSFGVFVYNIIKDCLK